MRMSSVAIATSTSWTGPWSSDMAGDEHVKAGHGVGSVVGRDRDPLETGGTGVCVSRVALEHPAAKRGGPPLNLPPVTGRLGSPGADGRISSGAAWVAPSREPLPR